ncbi:MAG: ATP-binding protein [Candidatus Babeliaceae bacterium]|nr:ATP-binding protein [Candidatus Babeliaceae bacterium]
MKRVYLLPVVSFFLVLSTQVFCELTQSTIDTVYKQQLTLVKGLIRHCKDRLPLVVDPEVAHTKTFEALDTLNSFLDRYPGAIECVIDTFLTCVNEGCVDVPRRVYDCIQSYEISEKIITETEALEIQRKVTALVVSYFKFQLTLLGALDYYGQDFLQRSQLATYLEIAKPWIAFFAVYMAINVSLKLLESLLNINTKTEILLPELPKTTSADSQLLNYETLSGKEKITKTIFPVVECIGKNLKTYAHDILNELNKSSFTKAVVAGLFAPNITPSIEKINRYLKENFSKSYAQIINKPRKSGYPAKPSKESFKTVNGYENTKLLMTSVIDFCINLDEYRAADLKMARGYLFEGPLADGRKMAFAVAGEITKKLKALGSPAQWLTYEIHGSSLVHRKLDKVLEECLEFGPTVLIITDIDWIYKQKDVAPEVYADIINRLTRYLSQESNFPILIFATSQDHSVIDPVLLEYNSFEKILLA